MKAIDEALWSFSVTVYGGAGVQEECLDLQDRFGIDVNLLLFCAYFGAVHGVMLSDQDVAEAAATVRRWHNDVVKNLRAARRGLRPFGGEPRSSMTDAAELLRTRVKAVELESEQIEQKMLARWSDTRLAERPRVEPRQALSANIRTLLANCGGPAQPPDLPTHLMAAALSAPR